MPAADFPYQIPKEAKYALKVYFWTSSASQIGVTRYTKVIFTLGRNIRILNKLLVNVKMELHEATS